MEHGGCVYILNNKGNTTLYVGVTSDLYSRVLEHKEKKYAKSFTAKYNLNKLVYFESFHSIEEAISREKQIKGGSRAKKDQLVNQMNPEWKNLIDEVSKW